MQYHPADIGMLSAYISTDSCAAKPVFEHWEPVMWKGFQRDYADMVSAYI